MEAMEISEVASAQGKSCRETEEEERPRPPTIPRRTGEIGIEEG